MLKDQRSRKSKLLRDRATLQKKLEQIDRQIAGLEGAEGGNGTSFTRGGRPRNEQSLPDAVHTAMKKSGKPMKVGEIVEAVESSGYQSSSANFRGIVNQALIKDERFEQHSRGVYKLA